MLCYVILLIHLPGFHPWEKDKIKLSKLIVDYKQNYGLEKCKIKAPTMEPSWRTLQNIHHWFKTAWLLWDVAMMLEITTYVEKNRKVMHFLEITL